MSDRKAQSRQDLVFSAWIVNKAGTLIYHRDFAPRSEPLRTDQKIYLASTFHGLHTISAAETEELMETTKFGLGRPANEGITQIETADFTLQCFQTLTGVKFFVIAAPDYRHSHPLLEKIYVLYADNVLKNPFYKIDMPIPKNSNFDKGLGVLVQSMSING
jgi:hypothetical protein